MKIAVWCHSYRDFGSDEKIRKKLNQLSRAKVDIILPFVHDATKMWYNSKLEGVKKEDVLTTVLSEAEKCNIQVHPVVLPIMSLGLGEDRLRRAYKPTRHAGVFCASWPENRETGIRIVKDILENHDVHGIHLDAIRYIDTGESLVNPCMCEACSSSYIKEIGKSVIKAEDLKVPGILYKFIDFRRRNIRGLVEEVRKITNSHGIKLSMAARANYFQSALVEGQDWVEWARDGLMDFICPMNYSTDNEIHKTKIQGQMKLIGDSVPIYDGIGRKSSAGEITPKQMIRQAEDALEAGAKGITIFHLNAMTDEDFDVLRELKKQYESI